MTTKNLSFVLRSLAYKTQDHRERHNLTMAADEIDRLNRSISQREPGKGYTRSDRRGRISIAVYFEPDLFARLRAMAIAQHKSMSATIEEATRVGLFDLEESDALEPPHA